jgi:hypothetical protein
MPEGQGEGDGVRSLELASCGLEPWNSSARPSNSPELHFRGGRGESQMVADSTRMRGEEEREGAVSPSGGGWKGE